ncbi:cysteine hydrolase family protein [Comamonas endophytica]|uniref:Cysteine hydrolase n=1 Tax=Comamonas endophytica TaxID=2949090 RepID=A0ABY6GF80_9BURK|nr:isochorismatase family cysteine hydrolase [Acidovorax sp. 5MLIR]MCD2514461.1 cysteine hydrolase [Acidovorax sp. D4N7]UYG53750.1 cysteine hydrolase [Acidovorax sp. 5MLIR]
MKTVNRITFWDQIPEIIDPRHTALLVVDVQNDFYHPDGLYSKNGKRMQQTYGTLPGIVDLVKFAQDRNIMVVFLQQITLPHGRSDSPSWMRLKCRDGKNPEYTLKNSWGAQLAQGLEPTPNDVVIEKFRSDAFVKTQLDAVLDTQGIRSLVVVGTSTEGCVESSIRGASYHDYYVVAVEDLICSTNPELHQGSMNFIKARYPVCRSEEIRKIWNDAR